MCLCDSTWQRPAGCSPNLDIPARKHFPAFLAVQCGCAAKLSPSEREQKRHAHSSTPCPKTSLPSLLCSPPPPQARSFHATTAVEELTVLLEREAGSWLAALLQSKVE